MRIVLVVVAAVVSSACIEPDPMECPQVHQSFRPRPLRSALAGVSTSFLVRAQCRLVGSEVSGVSVTVQDVSGAPIPFTVSEPIKEGETFTATVEFVPPLGRSTINARFDPELGQVEVAVVGMRDRAGETPVLQMVMPEECGELALAGGLVGCSGASLYVFLDGGVLAEEPRAHLRAGGDALWSWNTSGVTRRQGTQRAQLDTPLRLEAVSVSADETHLVIDELGDLWQFSATDGGALVREALVLDAGMSGFKHPAIPVDDGWLWTDEMQVCFRGVAAEPRCAPFDHTVIGVENDGFWVNDGRLGFVRFQSGVTPSSALYLDHPLEEVGGSSGVPRLSWSGRTVTVRSDTLELEVWPAFPGGGRATPTHFIGLVGTKNVTVFAR